jgi:hypothetical protein
MLVEGVADKLDVGIDDGRSQRLGTIESFPFNRVADGVRVDAQFTGGQGLSTRQALVAAGSLFDDNIKYPYR